MILENNFKILIHKSCLKSKEKSALFKRESKSSIVLKHKLRTGYKKKALDFNLFSRPQIPYFIKSTRTCLAMEATQRNRKVYMKENKVSYSSFFFFF